MLKRLLNRLALELAAFLDGTADALAARSLPTFANAQTGTVIQLPRQIDNPQLVHLGDDVKLGPNSVLRALTQTPGSWLKHPEGEHVSQTFTPELRLGDRVTATGALQLIAHKSVIVEDDVMFANNVFVCDALHGLERGDIPYKYQGMSRIAPVRIGRGAWLGQNVVVMPGVTIGELAIVGANSVVTKDIPAQSIALGAPAKVTRRWHKESETWTSVDVRQPPEAASS